MTAEQVKTKASLLSELERSWRELNDALDRLSVAQLTTLTDDQGWTVKDHLIHMAYWERSALFFLEGKPRHAGLDVEEDLYLHGEEDEINDAIFQKHRSTSLAKALEHFGAIHQQLLARLQPLSDHDLQKSYRDYLPNEPGEGDGPPAINVVYGNSAHHYAEHLPWIRTLVERAA